MTDEQQLKLQAFLDGELSDKDAREVAAWLAGDADATALLGELRNTRRALANFEPALKVPESREFYWSKIQREIQRREPESAPAPARSVSLLALLRRVLMPVGGLAVLAIAGVLAFHEIFPGARPVHVNAMLADAGAFTYRDQAQGMTVIWLSYPAQKKIAENGSPDTLPQK
jgi:anti-sigma factor RsiW